MADSPLRCVYTALTGRYERLMEQPVALTSALPFICFTDDPDLVSKTWQIRCFTPLLGEDAVRSQREVKLRPHRYLPAFDQSLYIDNSVLLKVPPEEVFAAVNLEAGLSLPAHSYRATILDEFARVAEALLDDPARIEEQLRYYRAANPDVLRQRPFWNAVMIRDHHSPAMIAAMELWFAHILRFSRRDQLSNNFVFDRVGLRPETLEIDNFSSWFHSWPHVADRKTEQRVWRKPADTASASLQLVAMEARYRKLEQAYEAVINSTTWRAAAPWRHAVRLAHETPAAVVLTAHVLGQRFRRQPSPRTMPRRLVFAFAAPASAFPSAIIRGQQLMQLIEQVHGPGVCQSSTLSGLLRTEGQVVVLTKSVLVALTPERLAQLRQRGHRLIADFVDAPVDPTLAAQMESFLASSVLQQRYLQQKYPDIPVYHITHHVDLRLPKVSLPVDRLRLGYFGAPQNLLHFAEIRDLVSIVPAGHPKRTGWMRRLGEFNGHCTFRLPQPDNAFKPFIKGFTAAHCGAPIIIGAGDAEARHYLGSDYELAIEDLSLCGVRAQLAAFAGAFGTPVWHRAVARMRTLAAISGQDQVKAELRAFIEAIL